MIIFTLELKIINSINGKVIKELVTIKGLIPDGPVKK